MISFLFILFSSFYLHAEPIVAAEDVSLSQFQDLAPGISIRFGSNPLVAELHGPEKILKKGKLFLRPIFKSGYFKTETLESEPGQPPCVSSNETPIKHKNDGALDSEAKLKSGSYNLKTGTLKISLQAPYVVDVKTDQLAYELKIDKASYQGLVQLQTPWVLPPTLAEILHQYQKISAAGIHKGFPPVVRRVGTDLCNQEPIQTFDFSNKNDIQDIGRIGDFKVVLVYGWVFAAHSGKGLFPFHLVPAESMTYLGDKYSIELNEEAKVTSNVLIAKVELGDFSGCFGSGCGTPINMKNALVSIDKSGKISTRIKKYVEAKEDTAER